MTKTNDEQIKDQTELSESELETVAGGVDGDDGGCTTQGSSKPWQPQN